MGTSHGDFVKYPRTPHVFNSKGIDDKYLSEKDSLSIINDESLIIEEKLDGTNVGIHFSDGELILQCRGHLITDGMHPQYDLFKQWTTVKTDILEKAISDKYILFGEWMYAKHSIHYTALSHYFYEFDIYDKEKEVFLTLKDRMKILKGTGVQTVPIVHCGKIDKKNLTKLIGPSSFDSVFENPLTHKNDNLMEGLYLRTESDTCVTSRAKFVRPEFVEKIKQSEHWQSKSIIQNKLAKDIDIWT